MANAAQNAPKFQLGKLSPDEAERLAASFRPVWELDDAPFAQGNGLSAAEVDALTAGVGVSPSIRGATERQPAELKTEVQKAPSVPAPHEAKVEIAIDIEPDPTPAPTPAMPLVVQAQVQPQPVRSSRPYTPPRAPPAVVKMNDAEASADYAPVKKSNTGLILGVAGVLVLGGAIFGVRAMMSSSSSSSTTASTATTSSPTHEEAHIPPPPDPGTQQPQVAQTAQPTQTAEKAIDPPVATHAVTGNVAAPVVHNAGGGARPTGGGATHATGGGGAAKPTGHIVRDNPF